MPLYTLWNIGSLPQSTMSSLSVEMSCSVSSAAGSPCPIQKPHRNGAPDAQPSHEFGVNSRYVPPIMSRKRYKSLNR